MRAPTATVAESAVEFFPSLTELSFVRHGFVGRVAGIDVATDRAEALSRLDAAHRTLRADLGFAADSFATTEQIHGAGLAVIDQPLSGERCFDGADGLITNQVGVSLGIYVADCCAIFLVDPVRHCLGLVHSGWKGTELAIVERAIGTMREHFGSAPRDLVVQLSPCIRPPRSLGRCTDRAWKRCTTPARAPPAICHAIIPTGPKKLAPVGCSPCSH
jgi:copper oxidase (laccase) domain-containing protein